MTQKPPGTAAIVRRIVLRALTVIGGSIAGTAIAWAISSSSASADPAEGLLPVPGVEQVAPLSDVVRAVSEIVPVPEVGTEAKQVTDDFGLAPPVPIDLGGLDRSDRPSHAQGGGTHEPPSLVRPVGEPLAAAPTAAINIPFDPDVLAAGSATDRALGDGMTRRGSPEPVAPWTPVAPASVPASGSSGHSGAGADSPAFAALPASAGPLGLTGSWARPTTALPPAVTPGAQPGVTPD